LSFGFEHYLIFSLYYQFDWEVLLWHLSLGLGVELELRQLNLLRHPLSQGLWQVHLRMDKTLLLQNKDVMMQNPLKVIPGRDLRKLELRCRRHLWSLGVMGVENMLTIV
jgi:hypothetical protein